MNGQLQQIYQENKMSMKIIFIRNNPVSTTGKRGRGRSIYVMTLGNLFTHARASVSMQ